MSAVPGTRARGGGGGDARDRPGRRWKTTCRRHQPCFPLLELPVIAPAAPPGAAGPSCWRPGHRGVTRLPGAAGGCSYGLGPRGRAAAVSCPAGTRGPGDTHASPQHPRFHSTHPSPTPLSLLVLPPSISCPPQELGGQPDPPSLSPLSWLKAHGLLET